MFLNTGLNDIKNKKKHKTRTLFFGTSKNGQKIAYDHSILVFKQPLMCR